MNQSIMLWRVCHLWPSGACFVFNCHRQQSYLIIRNRYGRDNIIHSREGVTKGDPLPMVDYGIGIIPLMKCLKLMFPDVTQPWYSDYYGALGTFDNLEKYFISLKRNGADRGYWLDPTKSITIMHPNNIKAGELSGQCHGSKVCTGALYLGGYIGDGKSKGDWLKKRTEKWESNVRALRKTSDKYFQKS